MAKFDATLDFQATSNPGGVWSYGYSESGGARYALIPFDKPTPGTGMSWTRRNYNTLGCPTVWRNTGLTALNGVAAGQLSLHPGPRPEGDFAILRFTAPRAGTYQVTGRFFAGDGGRMNARIVLRGNFDRPLQSFAATTDNSVFAVLPQPLNAGDTLDFVVGNNGDFSAGNTPLAVSITDTLPADRIALVLSGGGSRGDFQIGAVRYLYEKGQMPSILCGTSVGAINALKLAEGENAANTNQGLPGLLKIWQSLRTNDDMYLAEPWLFDPAMDPDLSNYLRGRAGSLPLSGPSQLSPAYGDILGAVYNFFSNVAFLAGPGSKLLTSLGVILSRARGLFNLSPIQRRLATDCDPALITAWADKGNQLRLATVALDSGKLRYVTERALLIERDGMPVIDPTGVSPACASIARELTALLGRIDTMRSEISALQAELSSAATGAKAALAAQIRSLGTQVSALATQAGIKRTQLVACSASNPKDFVLANIRDAALASSAIPGIFLPVKIGAEYYVDGGIREVAPIQSAVDLGASMIYAVHASSRQLSASVTPASAGLVDIVSRSLVDITIDEIDRSDRLLLPDANAAQAKIVHIEPLVDIHSITTIDPGLIQMSHDYGYMRAADVVEGASGRRESLASEITLARLAIWSMENDAAGQPDPTRPWATTNPPDPTLPPKIAQEKLKLKELIDERRRAGGPMPQGIEKWATLSELHPWLGAAVNDAAYVEQAVPATIPAGGTAPVTLTMRNTGTTTWQTAKGFALGALNPQDNQTWGVSRWPLPRDVAPNSQVVFTLRIPAPPAGGADFQWRMVQDNVGWFGTPSVSTRIAVGPAVEPAVCADLRRQMGDIQQQIVELTDLLTGNPRTDAGLRVQIANLNRSLASLKATAQSSGCAPI